MAPTRSSETSHQQSASFGPSGGGAMFSPPSRSRGLLDKVAGLNSLSFHEQSSSPFLQDERKSWTPCTIKVKPRGKVRPRESEGQDDGEPTQRDLKRGRLLVKTEQFDDRHGNRHITDREEYSDQGEKHRKILPRNVLQGWDSLTSRMEPMPYITVLGPTYSHFAAPHNYSKHDRVDYESGMHRERMHRETGIYENAPRIDQQRFHYLPNSMPFVPMMSFRSGEHVYPPSAPPFESSARGFPLLPHSVGMLDKLNNYSRPLRHQSHAYEGGANGTYDDDSDGIIYLGERNSFNPIVSPGFDVPNLPYLEEPGQAGVGEAVAEPSSVEKMDAVVNLMLVAAEVLDMKDDALDNRATSESSVDANNGDRSMSSPSPMSLSPLQTLAKLSTERLNDSLAKKSKLEGTATQSEIHKPTSIWIRGGQRSRNKDEVDKRLPKPYNRPEGKATTKKAQKTSGNLEWCIDFPNFEKYAAAKNSSPIRPGVALAQRPSLSDLPPAKGKRVNFANPPERESARPRSESESTPSINDEIQPALPAKRRRRGRPVKAKFEEGAEEQPAKQPQEVRRKPATRVKADPGDGESKSFVTRSGRRVKSVQYDV
ncbi:hypothetical protein QFC22_000558 [Naganishia vaughanmartiniae]|uniref:Uncharacterized protein n=1 Tax=Naganishia vaughanmartiniae TaxID=1424756 RepID=A0ACC2XQE4_9TREE|nr:hypothetical protein QFC22_000558 [Naganishia vaughanmartiniae]